MGDFYTEQLVKRKTPASSYLIIAGLVAATIIAVLLMMMMPIAFLLVGVVIVADYFVVQSLNVEYEYLYVNGSLDIDKIMSKSRRKKAFEMEVGELELVAPQGNPQLGPFRDLKAVDYSSRQPGAKLYEMVITKNGGKQRIIFEPESAILEGMRMYAPRKVIL